MGTSLSASAISFLGQVDLIVRVCGGVLGIAIGIMTFRIQLRRWRTGR